MNIFTPFQDLNGKTRTSILSGWLVGLICFWCLCALGTTHLFPTPKQVLSGLSDLYRDGLIIHLFSSLWLCTKAVFVSVIIALTFAYLSTIPFFKPVPLFISKLRYLPLTGISFYIAILINDARSIQVWVLVVFMTTFLITALLQMIKDIPTEEFDHARTLGCNRWEVLYQVVILGRLDYVVELVRQNLAIVWMMLVSIESILVAAGGLGFLIKNNDKLGDTGKVIALQIIIVSIGMLLDVTLKGLRKLIWRYSNF